MRCAILAPGPSMSQAVADSVRDYPLVIAVGNVGIDTVAADGQPFPALAPWAHALIAQDRCWWREHPKAHQFAGRKFSTRPIEDVEQIVSTLVDSRSNSGALALIVARNVFQATDIELRGFDMRGSHYFGPYTGNLRNTAQTRFEEFQHQFAEIGAYLKKQGVRVVNKTPNSALRAFPFE